MERGELWAPWRLAYIKSGDGESPQREEAAAAQPCFLCRYRDSEADRENLVLHRGRKAFVVLNRFPYNNGHLLIAPTEHLADPTEVPDETLLEIQQLQNAMLAALRAAMSPDGFNIGCNLGRVAGAGLPGHLHWHVVPRWNGDTNFMPVLADVNVIPQSLSALYDLLREHLSPSPGERGA